ncbi:aldehyde dehydrogenase family protein, partial [Candidatus Aerophobetes bacterium]|nr:aldehyde dehydrogenase family protein [Candidatus Aerophobetes bacterium]
MALLEEPLKEVLVLRNYIDGEWRESEGELEDVVNPATCKVIAKVPYSTEKEVEEAISTAAEAFP